MAVKDSFSLLAAKLLPCHDYSSPNSRKKTMFQKNIMPTLPEIQVGSKMNEFNNILSTLILQTEDTLQELPPGAETRQNLEEILHSSMKAKDLIRDLVITNTCNFARRGTGHRQRGTYPAGR